MNGKNLNSKTLRITSFPRIHITLIGMNNDGYRINGGIGFSISAPQIEIIIEDSDTIEVIDKRLIPFTEHEKNKLQRTIMEVATKRSLNSRLKYTIESDVPSHYGLGSNTAIYMSCLEALFIKNGIKYNQNDIVISSKRGGTSGIGIKTYFYGGYIFDVGVKNGKQLLLPSSIAERNKKVPLVMHKCKLPKWEIGICIPKHIQNKSEQEEVDFFRMNCPIDQSSVKDILYEAVYGITSSMIDKDYEVFCKSINKIQTTRWKTLERSLYGQKLIDLEQRIRSLGADCVGMSSLGPVVFFTGKNINYIVEHISDTIPDTVCFSSLFNNKGRIINYD